MNKATCGILALALVLGTGCGKQAPAGDVPINANIESSGNTTTTEGTPGQPATTSLASPTSDEKHTPSKILTAPGKTSFLVEVDDDGFYPATGAAKKGSLVTVTFKSRTSNVIYNGLEIRSNKYEVGYVKGGTSQSVMFPAEATITFSSFWPTGAYRGAWTLSVQ